MADRYRRLLQLVVLLALPLALAAQAEQALRLEEGRIRLLPEPLPLAGYFVLHNAGERPVTLIGAESPAFARAMVHQSVNDKGTARMQHVMKLPIPAGETVRFAPGGYHLMLMQRRQALEEGEQVPLTLLFEGGERLSAQFTVQRPGAE